MARPKKAAVQPSTPADPNAAQAYLAKARALVDSMKRKDAPPGTEPPVSVKAKAEPPAPVVSEPLPKVPPKPASAPPQATAQGPSSKDTTLAAKASQPVKPPPPAPKISSAPAASAAPPAKPAESVSPVAHEPAAPAKAPSVQPPPPKANGTETSMLSPGTNTNTPPAKNTFASPAATLSSESLATEVDDERSPLAPKAIDVDSADDGLQYNSQVHYYGSRGESWWRCDPWETYGGKQWFYDHDKQRYVFTSGRDCWVQEWDGNWKDESWNGESGDARKSPDNEATSASVATDTPAAEGDSDRVRSALAQRAPSQLEVAPDTPQASAEDPGDEAGDAAPPGDAPAPAQVKDEDKWRYDKHGHPVKPHALYMRFYRSIRSIPTFIKLIWLGCCLSVRCCRIALMHRTLWINLGTKNPVPPEVAEKKIEAEKSISIELHY